TAGGAASGIATLDSNSALSQKIGTHIRPDTTGNNITISSSSGPTVWTVQGTDSRGVIQVQNVGSGAWVNFTFHFAYPTTPVVVVAPVGALSQYALPLVTA